MDRGFMDTHKVGVTNYVCLFSYILCDLFATYVQKYFALLYKGQCHMLLFSENSSIATLKLNCIDIVLGLECMSRFYEVRSPYLHNQK